VGVSAEAGDAFQDLLPFNHCWGCGADNPDGLRLKSRWSTADPELAVAAFRPHPEHVAGPRHVLNGGIIATVLDCHGVCSAVADGYRRAGRRIGDGEPIWFATGTLTVTYTKPAPVDADLEVHARVERVGDRTTVVACELRADQEVRARATVTAVRVPPAWLET
jgi:acyl-coenzyme A thioesterase PaaI-like protein